MKLRKTRQCNQQMKLVFHYYRIFIFFSLDFHQIKRMRKFLFSLLSVIFFLLLEIFIKFYRIIINKLNYIIILGVLVIHSEIILILHWFLLIFLLQILFFPLFETFSIFLKEFIRVIFFLNLLLLLVLLLLLRNI